MPKTKTKNKAILQAFIAHNKLTVKSCMELCGTHKLSTRISEFEDKYNMLFHRKKVSSTSRFGGVVNYLEYSIDKNLKEKLKEIVAIIK